MNKQYVVDSNLMQQIKDKLLHVKEAEALKEENKILKHENELWKIVVALAQDGKIDPIDMMSKFAKFKDSGETPAAIKNAHYEVASSGLFGKSVEQPKLNEKSSPEEKFQAMLEAISTMDGYRPF